MSKVKIGKFELFCLISLYITASDKISGYYFRILHQDTLITFIFSLFGSIVLLSLYYLLFKRMNFQSFNIMLKNLLGSSLSKVLLVIYSVYFIFLASLDLKDITHLNHLYAFSDTNFMTISIFILFPVYVSLLVGIEATSRISNIFFISLGFIFIIFSIFLITTNDLQYDNIFPILETPKKTIIKHSILGSFSVPFGEVFVFTIFFYYLGKKKNILITSILGVLSSGLIVTIFILLGLFVLGPIPMELTHTPSTLISKRIDIVESIQRFDVIAIMMLVVLSYIKQFVLLFSAAYCLKHVLSQVNYKTIVLFITVLTVVNSSFFIKNYILYLEFRYKTMIPLISPIFEVYIPIFLLILSFIKIRNKNKKVKSTTTIQIN